MEYSEYTGNECCHIKSNIKGYIGNTRMKVQCKNVAKWIIGGGRLRCQEHFDKWAKKKGITI